MCDVYSNTLETSILVRINRLCHYAEQYLCFVHTYVRMGIHIHKCVHTYIPCAVPGITVVPTENGTSVPPDGRRAFTPTAM